MEAHLQACEIREKLEYLKGCADDLAVALELLLESVKNLEENLEEDGV